MIKKIGVFIAVIIIGLAAYTWWLLAHRKPTTMVLSFDATTTASGATGFSSTTDVSHSVKGPNNQGNIIDPKSDAAPIVGNNLLLGIDQNRQLGIYLLGYTGMTLYAYEKDTGASSTCYAQCAAIWPPYIVSGSDSINTQYGVNQSKVSIITREGGTLQVAYDGHPLYFYSGDTQETTNGQGQGGVWYVVKP